MSSAWNSAKTDNCTTSKQCFILLFLPLDICVLSIPFFIHIGDKRIGTSEDTRDPQPPKEEEIPKPQPQDVEEGEVYEVGEIVTTTGDMDVRRNTFHKCKCTRPHRGDHGLQS
ncbi:hypothetical protein AB205_0091600 [Aquarana catesbeiana]|uniref:Uncharacterized protein n=1 Tax=Aquarana catesbeiana TaxID=8400 RepID=A0A2G9Q1T9_AQUCT|nr:hypothetical protein AB205_0091600 [Aquarana catesbeiana]PIO09024.1 hypothetical protein AB205_0091600 [Aquarana catesbeiana]